MDFILLFVLFGIGIYRVYLAPRDCDEQDESIVVNAVGETVNVMDIPIRGNPLLKRESGAFEKILEEFNLK